LIVAAQELFFGIIEGLVQATPEILAAIPELIADILAAFAELGPQLVSNAITWGMDLIDALISGITNAIPNLISCLSSTASTIADYLGFSVPEKGPLHEWAYNNPGSDMIDLFTEGMENEDIALQRALYGTSNVIYNGMTSPDYSGALSGISSQLAGLGGGGNSVINVYLGSQRVGSVVTNALDTEYYLQGGT
jgi:hypothetical protein